MIDLALSDDIIVIDRVTAAVQELDILFSTSPTEMIGDSSYGVNFYQFLWQLTPNELMLERYIREKIQANTLYVKQLDYSLNVRTEDYDNEMIYIIGITLTDTYYGDSNDSVYKQYIIKK